MEFNSEQTLKEVNVSWHIDSWDLTNNELGNDLYSPKKCLDINCAFGYTTRYFLLPELHMNSTILGVDSSEKMIDYARKKYKNDERIDFDVLDIQTKNLPDNYIAKFDQIFSFPTVHSHNNIQQEFTNIYKMLKSGGDFYLTMIISHDAFTLYKQMANHPIFGSYFQKYILPFSHPERQVKQMLTRLGFVIQYYNLILNMKYKSDYLIPYIFYGLSFINELSAEQQEALRSELTNLYNKMEKNIDRIRHTNNNPNCQNCDYHDVYDMIHIYARKI